MTARVDQGRQALWMMINKPGESFRCGPFAVQNILAVRQPGHAMSDVLEAAKSTSRGTSLLEMKRLARSVGLDMQPIRRAPASAVPVPAMVHWRAGHFAAIVREAEGHYLVQDPTFVDELWISKHALDDEATGAFLVMTGKRPAGWSELSDAQAAEVWGKGAPGIPDTDHQTREDSECCKGGSCQGLATYSVQKMLAALTIGDIPLSHTPPVGPGVSFQLTYNQRDVFQPQTFPYSNFGPKWTFDWLSYVEDDPGNALQPVKIYRRGGGREVYTGYDPATQTYLPSLRTRAALVRTSSNPIRYERRLTDGSVEVFAQPVGAYSVPRKVLLTQITDPSGHSLTLVYDGRLRLEALVDAVGQVTRLAYENPLDHLKITRITDPFGRFATFSYYADGKLSSITDTMGLTSSFTYDAADFISSLTTPYGTTRFLQGRVLETQRWLEITDPLGGVERTETWGVLPFGLAVGSIPNGFYTGFLGAGATLHWDKRAMALSPGNPDAAEITYWLWAANLLSGIKRAVKRPLENGLWYVYPGQPLLGHYVLGSRVEPIRTTRVLDDGTQQTWRYEYNQAGMRTKVIDPRGRETVYVYGTNNIPDPDPASGMGIDLLEIKQQNVSGHELLSKFTYNANHQPLTSTDAAGQTTTTTYDAKGRVLTIVTPPRTAPDGGPLSVAARTTTYEYFADTDPAGAGRLKKITGPTAPQGAPVTQYTYDGHGRVRTVTDPDGYTVTYDYDAADRPTRTTYPDGTYEETVYNRQDAEASRDRLGRWSHRFHDGVRRVTAMRDALGRTTTQLWCACGSLDKLIDARGNVTAWQYDLQGRVTAEVRPDGQPTTFTYEATTSRLKKRTDAKGQVANYEYLPDDNLKRVSYTNAVVPTPEVSFTYDQKYNRVWTRTEGAGPGSTTTTHYYHQAAVPPNAPVLGATQLASVDGPLANDTVVYTYDELGRIASRGIESTSHVSAFKYDALGRVAIQTSALSAQQEDFTYTYEGVTGRIKTVTYPNSQTTNYSYFGNTGDRRLQVIKHQAPGGGAISEYNYIYDPVGNIKAWSQQVGAAAPTQHGFGYDAADQLTSARLTDTSHPPATLKRYGYAYDEAGNRTSEQIDDTALGATYNSRNQLVSRQAGGALWFRGTVNEPATVTVQAKPAAVTAPPPPPAAPVVSFEGQAVPQAGTNQVTVTAKDADSNVTTKTYQVPAPGSPTNYTYDLNGNLTSDGTKTYEWDAENRLVAVKQGTTTLASFVYDGLGRRVQKTAGGVTRTYIYDADEITEERGPVTLRFIHGLGVDQHFALYVPGGAPVYLLADHLGSIVQQTNAAGTVTFTREYDPWGNLLMGATAGRYAFTGREWDPETGLYYYRARYYHPPVARFLSEDPMRADSGLSLYAYARANPIKYTDPSGNCSCLFRGSAGQLNVNCSCRGLLRLWVIPEADNASATGATAGRSIAADGYVLGGTIYKIDGSTCVEITCSGGNAIVTACINYLALLLGKKAPYAVPPGTFGGPPKEPPPGSIPPLVR